MAIHSFAGITPTIHPQAFIHPNAVIIGDVWIGPDSSIWPGVVIRGDVNRIRIGSGTNIQDGSILHVTRPTTKKPNGLPLIIGDNVIIGHNAVLHACTLDSGCMIGMGAIVLDGAKVETAAMLGAGSLLSPGTTIPTQELWVGSPARRMRELSPDELENMVATILSYQQLAQKHRTALTLDQQSNPQLT